MIVLIVVGLSWYVVVSMIMFSDLIVIYNCSVFFVYVFFIFLLKEWFWFDKMVVVFVVIIGVLVVVYGGGSFLDEVGQVGFVICFVGNIVIGIGFVLYGFYEVFYK